VAQDVATPEFVTLVDDDDNAIGAEEKLRAHRQGRLHRAFSIFVFDNDENLLMQRRSRMKYHSAGLWSNTCCGHPRPGEATETAAARRLAEELGVSCELRVAFRLMYKADLGNSMIEHEVDHVFVGRSDQRPTANPLEVDEVAWVPLTQLRKDLDARPERYTYWLKLLLDNREWNRLEAILARSDRSEC